ncbi:nudix hydrolase 15, mitochondrial-like isoform X3 [Lycium barbarum]|uniref:nudix hydrolase 15, mitochondrial-like isoform X3 n=1 Tax=Lycium barbarum TaxID=112863 RepID=UPI00293F0327|nr:nudix hydrolase 15, mitochondrial-like isoform X3 [Lycium barbarum]
MATNRFHRSESLVKLAERLRLYNPNNNHPSLSSSNFFNTHSQNQECTVNEVVSKEQELKPEFGTDPINSSSSNSRRARAAVLVCLFEDQQGHLRVILTKRASTLSTHSGEVALPGGKVEEGDANDTETALREAEEEIGLDRSLVDIVTVLESFTTKKGIIVIPVVGILWDRNAFNPLINTAEVAAIFDAPLEMFLKRTRG